MFKMFHHTLHSYLHCYCFIRIMAMTPENHKRQSRVDWLVLDVQEG